MLLFRTLYSNVSQTIFIKKLQTKEYVEKICNDLDFLFAFACRKWYLDNHTI